MNFYDKVNELVNVFKSTDEYTTYVKLKNEMKKDEKTYNELKEFKEKQQALQVEFIENAKINEEKQKELESMYAVIIKNDKIKQILEYEVKLDVLLADMQKIIGNGIKEILEF